jgi:transcriptional regulator with XRE-family HTH domain
MPRPAGDLIRKRRQQRGLKVGELAALVRISKTHLGNVEAGRKPASIELLHRLATQFEVDVAELLPPSAGAA